MKALLVALVVWIFVVPVASTFFAAFTFLAMAPELSLPCGALALGFAIVMLEWGSVWSERLFDAVFGLFRRRPKVANSIQENTDGNVPS